MAEKKDKKRKERNLEDEEKSRALSFSLVLGFSVFGIYLAWELRSSPDTSTVAIVLLVVSLIAMILTLLNILSSKPERHRRLNSSQDSYQIRNHQEGAMKGKNRRAGRQ